MVRQAPSRTTSADAEAASHLGFREPRHVYNRVMRETAIEWERRRHHRPPQPKHPIKLDWAVSLENGFVPANEFPAKDRFDIWAQNCNSDYVLWG